MNLSKWHYLPLTCLLLACLALPAQAQRNGPVGQINKEVGPASATSVDASRSSKGVNAQSEVAASGPNGKGATLSASSRAIAGKGSGNATVTTNSGKSATASGQGQVSTTGATGSGTVSTGSGNSATGSASVSKTASGAQATANVSTSNGKSGNVAVDANKDNGSATVTTDKGSKTLRRPQAN